MAEPDNFLGYLRYSGKLVDEGYMDARKSAQALLGFDEAIKFFVRLENPTLSQVDFEIPVRIRKGSWEALIPQTIEAWIGTAIGLGASAYVIKAAQQMAANDFKNVGIKSAIRAALISIQWIIKIGKHVGILAKRKFENIKFRNNNEEVGISNENGEILFVPRKYLEYYTNMSPTLLSKMSELVEEHRELSLGVESDGGFTEENIKISEKGIFAPKSDDEEDGLILPDLVHGKYVELEGDITRGNENTNNLGIRYQSHILTCIPAKGSIVKYKQALFVRGKVSGTIDRTDRFGNPTENKPKIIFDSLIPLESDNGNYSLFEK